jgi:cytochrome P450
MHEKYGPIVRIMPDVVHVNDPAFIDQIYPAQAPDKKRERAYTVINKFLEELSVIPTKDHDLHRRRRAVLSPFFSQKNVRALVPTINETLANLLQRIEQAGASEENSVLTLNPLVRAATTDVIQSYAFGSNPENVLIDDCNAGFFETMSPKEFTHTCGHFPWLGQILYMLPPSLVLKLNPSAETFIAFMKVSTVLEHA